MSKIEKLKSIKNKILDVAITKENVTKCKNSLTLKGSYFKHLFSYIFLKKLKFKKIETPVEHFFIGSDGYNFPKVMTLCFLGTSGFLSFLGFSLEKAYNLFMFISTIPILLFIVMFFIVVPYVWFKENNKTNKKFNPENLSEIKEKIFENYNKKEIEQLLGESLKKQDLIQIFKDIEKTVGEKYFLDTFKQFNLHEKRKDITDPYTLLLIINKMIEDKKELNNKNERGDEIARAKKITSSLLKEKECSTV